MADEIQTDKIRNNAILIRLIEISNCIDTTFQFTKQVFQKISTDMPLAAI